MFAVQSQLDGDKVNLTLVDELVRKYRVDMEQTWLSPQGKSRDIFALAEKWFTGREILPGNAPQLGKLLR